ncbi:MAG: amidase domain-containing protein [Bacteroidia bacterium]
MSLKLKLNLLALVCITLIIGCKKEEPVSVTNSSNQVLKSELNTFVQTFFENKHQLLLSNKSSQANTVSRINSFFSTPAEASKCMSEINELNAIRATAQLNFTGFHVVAEVNDATVKTAGNETSFRVNVLYSYTTDGVDETTGDAIAPEGYELYNFTLTKATSGWQIVKQEQTYDETYTPGIVSFENEPLVLEKNSAAYTYSANTAANWATAHWNIVTNVSNYYDFTNLGGDCTNFLSRALREGGWKQTNYWFYKSAGASGNNMVLYKRSPSYTGANAFYQFISNTGQYAGINGNNRVTPKFTNLQVPQAWDSQITWNAFYNIVKTVKKGDIVELGNGQSPATIGHNMIVTKTQTTPPYVFVAYRNATGYLPAKDRPINEFYGRKLYGFYVKTSGN